MNIINEMRTDFWARPENEGFARLVISAFLLPLNPTLEELGDVKTSVSEAVTNAIVHGYRGSGGTVRMKATINDQNELIVDVIDNGCGIDDIEQAMKPFYTSCPDDDRSGMGFTVMESFMDGVEVTSQPTKGTTVRMRKRIGIEQTAARRA